MRLFYSVNSPYARKARVTVMKKELTDQVQMIETMPIADPEDAVRFPPELLSVNPLGKVPALLTDGGLTLCDSKMICEYLDQIETPILYPVNSVSRYETLSLAALADGIIDAAVSLVVISRLEEEQQSPFWITRHECAIGRTIDHIAKAIPATDDPRIGALTLAIALAYVNFRLPHIAWAEHNTELSAWLETSQRCPAMQATQPQS